MVINLNANDTIRSLLQWMKRKKREKCTYAQFFRKIKKDYKITKLDKELRKKILASIDGTTLSDGRKIIVDHKRKRILKGFFDKF